MKNAVPQPTPSRAPARIYRSGRAILSPARLALAWFMLSAALAQTTIEGTVINETTGRPQSGVILTLVSFAGGMAPIEEARSGADGRFAFTKSLPDVGAQQPMRGMLRTEFEGIPYSEMIRGGAPTNDIRVGVYSVSETNIPPPHSHVVILEPTGSELVISESFLYTNDSKPPRSFRDPVKGTLRFYLPPEAKGVVQVSYAGPARMPLNSSATPTGDPNIFKADVPLRPGDNQIDITYLVPHQDGGVFESRVVYPGVKSRIALPAGVTAESEALSPMGKEPRTQASLFETLTDAPYKLTISGQGRLGPPGGEPASSAQGSANGGGGGGGTLRVAPAPVQKELVWVLALTCGILGLGFYRLLTTKSPHQGATLPESVNGSEPAGGHSAKSRRRKR